MGRYIERVENVARLLLVTEAFSSARDGDSWRAILQVFADEAAFAATDLDPSPQNVSTYFLTNAQTPSSVISCLTAVKENARSLRHLLTTEAWVQISGFHARVAALSKKRLKLSDLVETCEEIRTGCHAHFGVLEATCYRDEVWLFNRIGAALERADQMTRLLDMKYFQIDASGEDDTIAPDVTWWNTLLRSASGYQAFRRRHSFNPRAEEAAAFFLFDPHFPRSVACALSEVFSCLSELENNYSGDAGAHVTAGRARLARRIERPEETLRGQALHRYLDETQRDMIALSNALTARYFSPDAQAGMESRQSQA